MSARGEQSRHALRSDRLAFWTSSINEVLLFSAHGRKA